MKTKLQARVYRFHDLIALNFDGTETVYLTSDMAGHLAAMMDKIVYDISKREFTESTLKTVSIDDKGNMEY